MLTALSVSVKTSSWCIDSGATNHMCNDRSAFSDYVDVNPIEVNVANGEQIAAGGRGNVKVNLKDCVKPISGVYYVPNLSSNLLSVSVLCSKGFDVIFSKTGGCYIYKGEKL